MIGDTSSACYSIKEIKIRWKPQTEASIKVEEEEKEARRFIINDGSSFASNFQGISRKRIERGDDIKGGA